MKSKWNGSYRNTNVFVYFFGGFLHNTFEASNLHIYILFISFHFVFFFFGVALSLSWLALICIIHWHRFYRAPPVFIFISQKYLPLMSFPLFFLSITIFMVKKCKFNFLCTSLAIKDNVRCKSMHNRKPNMNVNCECCYSYFIIWITPVATVNNFFSPFLGCRFYSFVSQCFFSFFMHFTASVHFYSCTMYFASCVALHSYPSSSLANDDGIGPITISLNGINVEF